MNLPQAIQHSVDVHRHGELNEAERLCIKTLAAEPDNFDALSRLGQLRHQQGRHFEAQILLAKALKRNANSADALSTYGRVLQKLGRSQEAQTVYAKALVAYDRMLASNPDDPEAFHNRGNALLRLNRPEEALASFDAAIALKPDFALAITRRGRALQVLNRLREALECYHKALTIRPDLPEAHYRTAIAHLRLGEFAEGWPLYEWRWQRRDYPEANALTRRSHIHRWNGERVDGTLLVWGEQGLGDEIVYSSMVPDLVGRTDSIVLEVEPRLVKLFARSFPAVKVIPHGRTHDAGLVAAQEPLGSLGRYLRANWEAFPQREHGYLVTDEGRAKELRRRLTGDRRTVVGLSWMSRAKSTGEFKSAKLSDFSTLLRMPGCRFVDLHYGDTHDERKIIERDLGVQVERLADVDNMNDIDSLAALMSACDIIVSISSATAHLAGALGKRTWVLVPHGIGSIWFWFQERDDSPWYPRVHVRRQQRLQSWADLANSLAAEISAFIESNWVRQDCYDTTKN